MHILFDILFVKDASQFSLHMGWCNPTRGVLKISANQLLLVTSDLCLDKALAHRGRTILYTVTAVYLLPYSFALILPFSSVSLSYFYPTVPMRKCSGDTLVHEFKIFNSRTELNTSLNKP